MIREQLPKAAGIALALSLVGCTNEVANSTESQPTIVQETASAAPSLEDQQLLAYQQTYGDCPLPISFSFGQSPSTESAGGETIAFVDKAGAVALTPVYDRLSEKAKRDALSHELTHACTNDGETFNPIPFSDGVITGERGFFIEVTTKTGVDTKFTYIDEAASEVLANHLNPNYEVPDEAYARMGSLLMKMMQQMQMTPEELSDLHKANDLAGLMSRYYLVPRLNISGRLFDDFMTKFQTAYAGQ